jgi:broad specificity phosphatase PhoE
MNEQLFQRQERVPQGVWRVWFVRHGQTAWNEQGRFCGHTDIPLSVRGGAQAEWLARFLHIAITRPVHVYSSDLSRARETANVLAAPFHVPVQTSPAWREIDFGAFEGLTYQEVETRFPGKLGFFMEPDRYAPLDGESLTHVVERTQAALTQLMGNESPSHDSIVVSHGGTLRALLCTLLGMPLRRQWQLRVDTASVSAVDLSFDEHGSLLATLLLLNMSEKYSGGVH